MARAIATPLLFATRKLGGKMVHAVFQPDHAQRLGRQHGMARDFGDEFDILACRQAWHQIVELEDEAHMVAAVARQARLTGVYQVVVFKPCCAGAGTVQPADDVEKCRLSGPRWPENDNELPGISFEIDATQRVNGSFAAAIHFAQPARAEHGQRAFIPVRCGSFRHNLHLARQGGRGLDRPQTSDIARDRESTSHLFHQLRPRLLFEIVKRQAAHLLYLVHRKAGG